MNSKINHRWRQLVQMFRHNLKWFIPGLGVKRWVGLILVGITLIGIGFGILILDIYRSAPATWWLPILSLASLRVFSRPVRFLIFGGIGFGILLGGIYGMNRAITRPFMADGQPIIDRLSSHRRRERGPKIVVIGGGHGLATLLRGLKAYTNRLTAVVTVADDGGSSGRLRESMGILPPGDLRNCLAALSNDETMISQLFKYRFASGDQLEGHSFGNLFISALTEITGSFEDAVAESGRVLGVHGRVFPSSLNDVRLAAEIQPADSSEVIRIEGESKIGESGGRVKRIWLEPSNPPAYPKVLQALLSADLIIIGPGSLYTSILPNLLVPDIAAAIRASGAIKIFVCNVATQPGETEGFSCDDHVQVIEENGGGGLIDFVVQNNNFAGALLEKMQWVTLRNADQIPYPIYEANLIDEAEPWHHNDEKLASVLIDLYQARTGPLADM